MYVYVLIAIDEDYKVRECLVVTDEKAAHKLRVSLSKIWGGANVCMAHRQVDHIPPFNRGNLFNQEIDELLQGADPRAPGGIGYDGGPGPGPGE